MELVSTGRCRRPRCAPLLLAAVLAVVAAAAAHAQETTILRVERADPSPTNSTTVSWTVTLSQTVRPTTFLRVGLTDATTDVFGFRSGSYATGAGNQLSVTVSGLRLDPETGHAPAPAGDTVSLELSDPLLGVFRTVSGAVVEDYVVDLVPPTVAYVRNHEGSPLEYRRFEEQLIDRFGGQHDDLLTFIVRFSEKPEGVTAESFRTTGVTDTTITAVVTQHPLRGYPLHGGTQYHVFVKGGSLPGHNGVVRLALAPDHGITDAAGNPLAGGLPAEAAYYHLDHVKPTPTLTGVPEVPLPRTGFTLTVDFDEYVEGFAAADLTVTGADVSDFKEVTEGRRYTATVTPKRGQALDLGIAADAVTDRAGNGNVAARVTRAVRSSVGLPTITSALAQRTENEYSRRFDHESVGLQFTLLFSEPVQGVTGASFRSTGVTDAIVNARSLTRDVLWVITLTGGSLPDYDGLVGLELAPNHGITDLDGNPLAGGMPTSGPPFSFVLDHTAPRATISGVPSASATTDRTAPFTVTVDFDEPVTGFAAGGLTATGATVYGLRHVPGSRRATATVKPRRTATRVVVTVAANAVTDRAGNGNAEVTAAVARAPAVSASEDALTAWEGEQAAYAVRLETQPSGAVTVTPVSGDPSVATVSRALTFTATDWHVPQTVTVIAADDRVDNPSNTAAATITHRVGSTYAARTLPEVRVTVHDDETTLVASSQAVSIAGEASSFSGAYTIRPASAPRADFPVVVRPVSSDTDVATVSAELTFTHLNWNTARTVVVRPVDDAIDNPEDRTATITHRTAGDYQAVAPPSVKVTDDDTAGVVVSHRRLVLDENVGNAAPLTYTP